jgi:hypothetical protein
MLWEVIRLSVHFATNPRKKAELAELILNSEKPLRVEIEEGEQRTITQNARHWALIQGASQYLKNAGIFDGSAEALHIYVKRQILGTKAVTLGDEVFYLDAASRKMTKKQFKLFDEKLEPFLLQELNVPYEYLLPKNGGGW